MRKNAFLNGLSTLFLCAVFGCAENEEVMNVVKEPTVQPYAVSIEEAKADLTSILDATEGEETRSSIKDGKHIARCFSKKIVKEATTRSMANDTLTVHIFNFSDNQGYAIMSGDKRLPSLLVLTEQGNLSDTLSSDNPAFISALSNIEDNISAALIGGGSFDPDGPVTPLNDWDSVSYSNWTTTVYKQGGYCSVKWGQDYPYNNLCPMYGDHHSPTGCVATAVAQLMATYKYPNSYNNYQFDWDKMVAARYGLSSSKGIVPGIPKLMSEIGKAGNLSTEYGDSSSSAYLKYIPRTLKNFGYSSPGELVSYSVNDVVQELQNGYCVLLGGFSFKTVHKKAILGITIDKTSSYSGGHCWLAHGLMKRQRQYSRYKNGKIIYTATDTDWYLLCNWGWNSKHDGYFISSSFDATKYAQYGDYYNGTRASDEDGNYQYKLQAILNIRK